jgi:hypothetical protein
VSGKMWDLYMQRAIFGPGETHRYGLIRTSLCLDRGVLCPAAKKVLFVMLNPSTADAQKDDPTVRRCLGYARRWGYCDLLIGNIFALRSTDPAALYRDKDPVGQDNDAWLLRMARHADRVICAWGKHGALKGRGATVLEILRAAGVKPLALRLTKDGHPGHPLYLPADAEPMEMAW